MNPYKILSPEKIKYTDKIFSLMSDKTFKYRYMRGIGDVLKKKFTEKNKYGLCEKNGLKGVLTNTGEFHWVNRLNTNSTAASFFASRALDFKEDFFVDLDDPNNKEQNADRLVAFFDDTFELYFEKPYNTVFYNHLKNMLNYSWDCGNISMITVLTNLKRLYPNYQKVDFDYEPGGIVDMKDKIDFSLVTEDGEELTFQVKTGFSLDPVDGFYKFFSSTNDLLHKKCTHYAYASVQEIEKADFKSYYKSNVFIFKNDSNKIEKRNDLHKGKTTTKIWVPQELMENVIKDRMMIPENLYYLMKLCAEKRLSFTLQKEGNTNFIKNIESINDDDVLEKKLVINFADIDDESFIGDIMSKIAELNDLT